MHTFNNPIADNSRKTLFWRMYTNAIVRNILNTKTNATIKIFTRMNNFNNYFAKKKRKVFFRVYFKAIVRKKFGH